MLTQRCAKHKSLRSRRQRQESTLVCSSLKEVGPRNVAGSSEEVQFDVCNRTLGHQLLLSFSAPVPLDISVLLSATGLVALLWLGLSTPLSSLARSILKLYNVVSHNIFQHFTGSHGTSGDNPVTAFVREASLALYPDNTCTHSSGAQP